MMFSTTVARTLGHSYGLLMAALYTDDVSQEGRANRAMASSFALALQGARIACPVTDPPGTFSVLAMPLLYRMVSTHKPLYSASAEEGYMRTATWVAGGVDVVFASLEPLRGDPSLTSAFFDGMIQGIGDCAMHTPASLGAAAMAARLAASTPNVK